MGAQIVLKDGQHAVITGVEHLHGEQMDACELRGGAALVLAGLAAEGESFVTGQHFIESGYENICRDFRLSLIHISLPVQNRSNILEGSL